MLQVGNPDNREKVRKSEVKYEQTIEGTTNSLAVAPTTTLVLGAQCTPVY